MKAQSPLHSAERIRAPLLIVQGANDPRVKKAESDQIVRALRDLGREVEYLVAADEGHGFASEESNQALFAKVEEFLAAHLGGRYQADVPARVRRRLDELAVEVATV
jgi:dipeptidyl aminopeptidase/acylaminoacyl peptidase